MTRPPCPAPLPGTRGAPGVTLVELMVSLAVLAILSTLAAPSFVDFIDRGRVRAAADAVVSLISNSRAEAVKRSLDVNVAMAGSGTAWCIAGNAPPVPAAGNPAQAVSACDCLDNAPACDIGGERHAIEVGAYPDVAVGTLPGEIVFDGTLGATASMLPERVTLTSPRGKYDVSIQVNPLGQARLCVPDGKPVISGIAPC